MTFTGYCSLKDLVSFLDIGEWIVNYTLTNSYIALSTLTLPTTNASGINTYVIKDTVKLYANGTLIPDTNYTVNYETNIITFTTAPTTGHKITATYYISSAYDSDDLEYYLLLGATELEYDSRQIFREMTVTDYIYNVEEGLDYTGVLRSKYIDLPYSPILDLDTLEVNAVEWALDTVKIIDNKIFTTSRSPKLEFTSEDVIKLTFTYGIPDDTVDQTDEQIRLLMLASEANKIATALIMAESPLGRNVFIDNSKVTQMSKGDVRPELFNEAQLRELKTRYNDYINKLRALSSKLL
jgi:hypothetical protein